MQRREVVRLLGVAPLAGALPWSLPDVQRAAEAVARLRARGQAFQPKVFTPHEYRTVRVLVDMIIPRDERSGSATDAGVPEFMDFMMSDRPQLQEPLRGGLAWLDTECRERFGNDFVDGGDAQRRAVLDDIAWPARAKPEMSQGVAFFNRFRDLTASGFWSSKRGVADLPYLGNTAVPEWKGCPEEQLKKLRVSYGD
jgi:gluconate 2-dehydrogenase gamma chain